MRKSKQLKPVVPVTLAAPAGADAALYFLDGQYVFQAVRENALIQKFVAPAAVREAFAKEPADSGWLPANVARGGHSSRGQWMVRWNPPALYTITIEGRAKPLRVPMPSLIWFGQKTHYYIFAAREEQFTDSNRVALYHAPLPNVNSVGLICFGKNEHPDVAKGGFDKSWRTFWDAPFNDHQDDGKSRQFPNSVNEQLIRLARAKATAYPLDDLVAMNISLERAIERLARRGNEWD